MPRWFGLDYHHRHRRASGEHEEELQIDHQQSKNQLQNNSYFIDLKNYFIENYFDKYYYSDLPHDYYHNPDHHEGITHEYLQITLMARELVENDYFNYAILFVIIIAGVNIGIQSYQELSDNPSLALLDDCILIVFSFECILKMFSEGLAPYMYFIGADWRWNVFDFTIVFMSLPFWGSLFGGGSLALLRLVRLMRLGKLIKKIPQLQMIVQGLTGGLSSIGYILLLLFLVFYLFAIAGYYVFHKNDPFHFGSLPKALVTCFVCATLDAWSDIMFINSYGCDKYPMVYEFYNETEATTNLLRCSNPNPQFVVSTLYFILLVVISALVMLSLFIGAVTLSMQDSLTELKELASEKKRQEKIKKQLNKMFQSRADIALRNGASTHLKGRVMSRMSSLKNIPSVIRFSSKESNQPSSKMGALGILSGSAKELQLQNFSSEGTVGKTSESAFTSDKKDRDIITDKAPSPVPLIFHSGIPQQDSSSSFPDSNSSKLKKRASQAARVKLSPEDLLAQSQISFSSESEETMEMRRKLRIGVGDIPAEIEDEPKSFELFLLRWDMNSDWKFRLSLLAEHSKFIAEHEYFVEFVTYVIILAGVTVGMSTEPRLMNLPHVTDILHVTDRFILAVFTLECILKLFGEYPKPWVYFGDSWNKFDFIIVVGSYTPGVGSLLTILRLLRLLRVLKLVKSLPQLVVIVNAMMMGIESIAYIALILFLCFYVFAILGMMLFRANDPFNFGSLHMAMFTLFRCSTLDAWADLLYINIYGCDIYPGDTYSSYPELCTSPHGSGVLAAIYFLIFIVIGAQILLTLFIGVVTTSMEEAQAKETRENKVERQLHSLQTSLDLTDVQVRMFREVFNTLDLDGGGLIEEDEVQIGLKAIGDLVEGTNVEEEIKKADPHGKGIDLVTFIVVFCNIPSCRHRRVLRKTVRRWLTNKRKKGMFFQPRRNLLRKHTNVWASNARNFLEGVERKFMSSSSSNPSKDSSRASYISYFSSNNSLNPWKSGKQNPIERKGIYNQQSNSPVIDDLENFDEVDETPVIEKQPSFISNNILKNKGSLVRRSSTTTLYQTPHEMETAAFIGHHLSNSPELERLGSDRRSHSSERLNNRTVSAEILSGRKSPDGSYERQRSMSPTLVRDFEEQRRKK